MNPANTSNTSPASGDAPQLTPQDFLRARHRVNGKDVDRKTWAAAVREKLEKQRVSTKP